MSSPLRLHDEEDDVGRAAAMGENVAAAICRSGVPSFLLSLTDGCNTDAVDNYLVAIPGVEAPVRVILPKILGFRTLPTLSNHDGHQRQN